MSGSGQSVASAPSSHAPASGWGGGYPWHALVTLSLSKGLLHVSAAEARANALSLRGWRCALFYSRRDRPSGLSGQCLAHRYPEAQHETLVTLSEREGSLCALLYSRRDRPSGLSGQCPAHRYPEPQHETIVTLSECEGSLVRAASPS